MAFSLHWPPNHNTASNQPAENEEENCLMHLFSFCVYKVLTSKAGQADYMCALCCSPGYAFTLTRVLWQHFYRSHNMTEQKQRKQGLIQGF